MSVAALPSSCTVCDSPTVCDHPNAARYLAPIAYEEAASGWSVPDVERPRWDRPVKAPPPAAPGTEALPLALVVKQLAPWVDLDDGMQRRLEYAYELDALRVTRISATVARSTESGHLKSPGGLLWKRLGEIIKHREYPA